MNPISFTLSCALQSQFLHAGADRVIQDARLKQRVLGEKETDHPATAINGYIGMAEELAARACVVAEFLGLLPNNQEFPGVFEYEVTESMSVWWANNPDTTPFEFKAELAKQAHAFFAQ